MTKRRQPVAAWPEGAVAVTIWPRTRELASWLSERIESVEINAIGTVLLVRMREDVMMRWIVRLGIELFHTPLGWEAQRLFGWAACNELVRAALYESTPLPRS